MRGSECRGGSSIWCGLRPAARRGRPASAPAHPTTLHRRHCQVRAHRGYLPLVIVVIGLIYSRRRATKLSSTDLREEDAASVGGGSPRSGSPRAGGSPRSGSPRAGGSPRQR